MAVLRVDVTCSILPHRDRRRQPRQISYQQHAYCVYLRTFGDVKQPEPAGGRAVAIRFGVGIPSCREGTAYPVPYVRPSEFATLARRAEELGFYSLWANDHFTTPHVIQATQEQPPNF